MLSEGLPGLVALMIGGGLAGALNAVAGGGSFITLPLLVLAGLPAISANATGTVALLPGYLASAHAYRQDVAHRQGVPMVLVAAVSLAGGMLGALLLLLTPTHMFDAVIPWLLLAATAVFAVAPALLRTSRELDRGSLATTAVLLPLAVYGGYFNGGLGIVLLAGIGLLGVGDLHAANGIKNIASATITTVAVAVYVLGGLVSWAHAGALTMGTIVGGYLGARLARRVDQRLLRRLIVLVGLSISAVFFAR